MFPNTKLDVIFGAMTFGREGEEQVRTSKLSDATAILDAFQKHKHNEIDTARFYGSGTSEQYLGELKYQERSLIMDTKFYPNTGGILGRPVTHLNPHDMRQGLDASLTALRTDCVDLWYLHSPDRSVPLEETLAAVNEFYKEGKFKRWGISNFMSWEVATICEMCERNGWVKPSVYQGVYNALHRSIEHELIPCLRKYGLSFYAFNPLAGGALTDRYHRNTSDDSLEAGSRFDPKRAQGQMYRARYWNDAFFDALDLLRPVTAKHGLRESECALRWIMHHSVLKREFGDKIIIGASSEKQLEMNLNDFEAGELPTDVIAALDQGWEICRGMAWKYFH